MLWYCISKNCKQNIILEKKIFQILFKNAILYIISIYNIIYNISIFIYFIYDFIYLLTEFNFLITLKFSIKFFKHYKTKDIIQIKILFSNYKNLYNL